MSPEVLLIASSALGLLSGIIGTVATHLLILAREKRKEKLEQLRREEEQRRQASEKIRSELMQGVFEFSIDGVVHGPNHLLYMLFGCVMIVAILVLILSLLLVPFFTFILLLFCLSLFAGRWAVFKILRKV